MLIQIEYPSIDFRREWRNAVNRLDDFCIDARLGSFRAKSIQGYIDFMCNGGRYNFSFLGAILCGSLNVCIVKTIATQQYEVECLQTPAGISIKFKSKLQ